MKNAILLALCLVSTLSYGMQNAIRYTLKGVDTKTFSIVQYPDRFKIMDFVTIRGEMNFCGSNFVNNFPAYAPVHLKITDSKETVIEVLRKAFRREVIVENI